MLFYVVVIFAFVVAILLMVAAMALEEQTKVSPQKT